MEKFIIGEIKQESLHTEIVRRNKDFIRDSRRIFLNDDIVSVNLINKLLATITSYKDVLIAITPKNDEEEIQIKTALEELNDLENFCEQRKVLH